MKYKVTRATGFDFVEADQIYIDKGGVLVLRHIDGMFRMYAHHAWVEVERIEDWDK